MTNAELIEGKRGRERGRQREGEGERMTECEILLTGFSYWSQSMDGSDQCERSDKYGIKTTYYTIDLKRNEKIIIKKGTDSTLHDGK